ncbi:hypothetical protein F5X96DRAFT_673296 [Biscogniauxia mediterranea]|nr:hypothetical protein F5X96DRAFT_673296 [Biscogniauxia mediterranea]
MATSSAQQYAASTANKGSGMNRKRALDNDKEFSNPPAKVRKVANYSHDTPHLGSNPATHHLQHEKDDPTQGDKTGADTDDEESDREKSSDTTGDKCPSTPNTTPNTTPDTTPRKRQRNSWWYRDGTKVVVYKRDDFTGRTRRRRMMDDMYANASPEKMKKYKQYYFRYMCKDATASSEDLDDSEYSDDDSEDGCDDDDDEGEGTKRSEGGDEEEEGQDQDQDQIQEQEQEDEDEDVIEDEESEDEQDDDYEDKEGEGDEDYDEE